MRPADQRERPSSEFSGAESDNHESGRPAPQIETQSFLVRIWREAGDRAGDYFWRGHVTQIGSGRRKYVQSFEAMALVMAQVLPAMGVRLSWKWRTKLWLQERKRLWLSGK